MTDNQSTESGEGGRPGKSRTLWHPLFARLLSFSLSSAYTIIDEVNVGKMPLRVDILLLRREGKELPESKKREVAALLPLLNRFTLMEFKGPTDSLERGDFAQLIGCAFLWHSQQADPISHDEVSLVVLAPTINRPLREELRLLGYIAEQTESGIFRVAGLPFAVWIVETDVMGRQVEPILSPVSRVFLKEHHGIIKELRRTGHAKLIDYALQQVHYIQAHREGFGMQAEVSDEFAQMDENIVKELLESLPPEQILRAVPPAVRLQGLSLEERLAGLSEEDKARLADLLTKDRTR